MVYSLLWVMQDFVHQPDYLVFSTCTHSSAEARQVLADASLLHKAYLCASDVFGFLLSHPAFSQFCALLDDNKTRALARMTEEWTWLLSPKP